MTRGNWLGLTDTQENATLVPMTVFLRVTELPCDKMKKMESGDRVTGSRSAPEVGTQRFSERVAIVTGSTAEPSIGRSCAFRLAREGASVVVNGRDEDRVGSTEAALRVEGHDAIGVVGSMDTEEAVAELADRAVEAFGRIDLIVSTLGGAPYPLSFDSISEEQLLETFRLNTWPALALIRAAMARGSGDNTGAVVTISSGSPRKTTSAMVSYAAAKAALNAMTRTIAADLADQGCTCEHGEPRTGAHDGDSLHVEARRWCGCRLESSPRPPDGSRGHRRCRLFPAVRRRTADHGDHPGRRRREPSLERLDTDPIVRGCPDLAWARTSSATRRQSTRSTRSVLERAQARHREAVPEGSARRRRPHAWLP